MKLREDTELKHFPLFYPKCKQENLINVKQLNMSVVRDKPNNLYGEYR
ncbi:cysteine-rich KTR domain-containing protein [Proteiniborus sp. MB09-C3]|nr:cysteine-rich KTR domain-containing protein [Proteiniborus sp. MB09-C3]WIV13926.1 cysteine-rich KTR domain-containing protein [Proteiniborus sp. MB09-C3]